MKRTMGMNTPPPPLFFLYFQKFDSCNLISLISLLNQVMWWEAGKVDVHYEFEWLSNPPTEGSVHSRVMTSETKSVPEQQVLARVHDSSAAILIYTAASNSVHDWSTLSVVTRTLIHAIL